MKSFLYIVVALLIASSARADPLAPRAADWNLTRAKVQAMDKTLTPDTCPSAKMLCPTPKKTAETVFKDYRAGLFYEFTSPDSEAKLQAVTYVFVFDVPGQTLTRTKKAFYDLDRQLSKDWGKSESVDKEGTMVSAWKSKDLMVSLKRETIGELGILTLEFRRN